MVCTGYDMLSWTSHVMFKIIFLGIHLQELNHVCTPSTAYCVLSTPTDIIYENFYFIKLYFVYHPPSLHDLSFLHIFLLDYQAAQCMTAIINSSTISARNNIKSRGSSRSRSSNRMKSSSRSRMNSSSSSKNSSSSSSITWLVDTEALTRLGSGHGWEKANTFSMLVSPPLLTCQQPVHDSDQCLDKN